MVFGERFESEDKDYFAFVNNYIVFSNSVESLRYFIYQVILGNTLSADFSFNSIKEYISSQCNYFIYLKPLSSLEMILPSFNPHLSETIRSSRDNLRKFNIATIQFSATENSLYNRIFLNFSGQVYDNVNTVWESRMDTPVDFKPAIVLNHNTGEKEILIQDKLNQVYLLSNAGVIYWKLKIDGPILSDIFQVDYYRNKKLQYLFNTSSRIYMIDRNGNPVEKFPIDLRQKATSGMSVFDYDKDGTLRICLPAEDREIYMYDIEGKIIPGWRSRKTDNLVIRPVQHFRINKKDYIIAIDRFKFYILDRRGNVRIKPSKSFPVSEKNIFYIDYSNDQVPSGFITTDTTGNIMRVRLDGKAEKLIGQKLSPDHFFISADLNGDKKTEYLFTSGNKLSVINNRGKEIFSDELPGKIVIKPLIYNFAVTDNKIGIVLNEKGIIYLYNNNGSIYRGFPLEGSSSFSISNFPGFTGKFNLIVGSKENFLLNYSVQ